jgi:hypothetical protein
MACALVLSVAALLTAALPGTAQQTDKKDSKKTTPKKLDPDAEAILVRLRAWFAKYDANKDGRLDQVEIRKLYGTTDNPLTKKADKDDDDEISLEEFETWAVPYAIEMARQQDELEKEIKEYQQKLQKANEQAKKKYQQAIQDLRERQERMRRDRDDDRFKRDFRDRKRKRDNDGKKN